MLDRTLLHYLIIREKHNEDALPSNYMLELIILCIYIYIYVYIYKLIALYMYIRVGSPVFYMC
jgi:hypothetical protein